MLDPGHPELRVGVLVWVEIDGQLSFAKPVAIEKIYEHEGGKIFFVEGSSTGLTADNLTLAAVEFALDYARRGWPVFPCKPTDKSPYIRGGLKAATTDQETIRRWWQRWPHAMIGVPMGSRSGVWAIDPDPPKKPEEPDGRAVWASLLQEHDKLPATHTESTPRGGQHVLFKWDPERPVSNSPSALGGQNIDVRGEGGYVIMAPSVCADGGRYSVIEPLNFFHFAMAPDWLYELVLRPKEKSSTAAATPPHISSFFFGKSEFWRKVNSIAFQRLDAWVPEIFGRAARFEPGTGAYRISSRDLGRDLEEDLSISPLGAKDWGVWDIGDAKRGKRSAIDIVIEYGGKRDATEAALWLCERCGVEPATLGWATGERWSFNSAGYDFNKAGPQGGQSSVGDDGSAGSKAGWDKSNPGPSQTSHQASSAGIKLDYYENFGKAAAKKSIIKGVIFKGERSSWIGPPGCGKSALLANIAIHAADGHDWRGYRSKDRVGVVYFALERSQLVKRRLMVMRCSLRGRRTCQLPSLAGSSTC